MRFSNGLWLPAAAISSEESTLSLHCETFNRFTCLLCVFTFCFHFLPVIMWPMTEKQKNNLAKFFYDIAKIDFAALVVAQFANPSNIRFRTLALGIISTIIPLLIALSLDRKENKNDRS